MWGGDALNPLAGHPASSSEHPMFTLHAVYILFCLYHTGYLCFFSQCLLSLPSKLGSIQDLSPFGSLLIISKSLPDLTQSIKLSLEGKCSSHPSSKKHPFTANGEHYRKQQLDIMQKSTDHGESRLIRYIDNIIPVPKAQRTPWKNGAEIL